MVPEVQQPDVEVNRADFLQANEPTVDTNPYEGFGPWEFIKSNPIPYIDELSNENQPTESPCLLAPEGSPCCHNNPCVFEDQWAKEEIKDPDMVEIVSELYEDASDPDDEAVGDRLGSVHFGETTINEFGGRQSKVPYRCDLLPPKAILSVAEILYAGAVKYGENNWHNITVADNVNHALGHLYLWLDGDTSEDHLSHAACRILFALDSQRAGRKIGLPGEE